MDQIELSYKTVFLGPHSENEYWVRKEINEILDFWFKWRKTLFKEDPSPFNSDVELNEKFQEQRDKISFYLKELNEHLKAETPKYTPRYIGHMVSELSLPAIFGHFASLLHNPNNTSKDVSRVGAVIEREAIEMLAGMIGYDSKACKGHFTSGGTLANFEAVWRARFRYDHWMSLGLYLAENHHKKFNIIEMAHMGWSIYEQLITEYNVDQDKLRKYSAVLNNPYQTYRLISKHSGREYLGPVVFIPGNKHFSWQKAVNIFGLGEEAFWTIPLNQQGKIDINEYKKLIEKAKTENRPILLVVSVAGTTETGTVDSISEVQSFLDELKKNQNLDIWHHVDAAYGGFFCSLLRENIAVPLDLDLKNDLEAISCANSVTLDPHKLGYVPYSCGAIITKNSENYMVSSFMAPYLVRSELGESKWAYTMEGSRTASGASATWLTGKSIGYPSKVFASILYSTIEACQVFKQKLQDQLPWVQVLEPTHTNVLCFSIANLGDSLKETNNKTLKIFKEISEGPQFAVSKTSLGVNNYELQIRSHINKYKGYLDDDHLVLIRCVFMNPFWGEKNIQNKLIPEFIDDIKVKYQKLNSGEI